MDPDTHHCSFRKGSLSAQPSYKQTQTNTSAHIYIYIYNSRVGVPVAKVSFFEHDVGSLFVLWSSVSTNQVLRPTVCFRILPLFPDLPNVFQLVKLETKPTNTEKARGTGWRTTDGIPKGGTRWVGG